MSHMLTMFGTDMIVAFLFVGVYWAGATGKVPEPAFLPLVVLLFAAATVFWVRTEARQGLGQPGLRRAGRIAGGLAACLVAAPALLLTPLFAFARKFPGGNPLEAMTRRSMALLLIALTLVVLMNLAGSAMLVLSVMRSHHKPVRPEAIIGKENHR